MSVYKLLIALSLSICFTPIVWAMDSSYESCVRNNLGKAKTAQAVAIIKNTCKEKFGQKAKVTSKSELPTCTVRSKDDYCSFLIKNNKAKRKLH